MQTTPATFLLQFQEPLTPNDAALTLGTSTGTKTHEEPDQDPGLPPAILAATQTATLTIEESDQDPRASATQTGTAAIEEPDQDQTRPGYFAIPRT